MLLVVGTATMIAGRRRRVEASIVPQSLVTASRFVASARRSSIYETVCLGRTLILAASK
jgi:hypothetical protein